VPDPIRVTAPLLDVLEVLLAALSEDAEVHGWSLARSTGLSGPTVYGVIDRLESAGWVTGCWEDENPQPGKPRRRLYRLTPTGATSGRDLLEARRPYGRRAHPRPAPGMAMLRPIRFAGPGATR
jgi:PadR family transcriptional regulator